MRPVLPPLPSFFFLFFFIFHCSLATDVRLSRQAPPFGAFTVALVTHGHAYGRKVSPQGKARPAYRRCTFISGGRGGPFSSVAASPPGAPCGRRTWRRPPSPPLPVRTAGAVPLSLPLSFFLFFLPLGTVRWLVASRTQLPRPFYGSVRSPRLEGVRGSASGRGRGRRAFLFPKRIGPCLGPIS